MNIHGVSTPGQWENKYCWEEYPYICSREQSNDYSEYEYPQKYSMPNVKCNDGWIPYHSGCYRLFLDNKTYEEASTYCKENGPENAKYTG